MRTVIIKIESILTLFTIMYVCICHGITDKDIQKASNNGAKNLNDLQSMTGCATGCGSCASMAMDILESHNKIPATLSFYPGMNPRPLAT